MKVSSISSEVGLAIRTPEKPTSEKPETPSSAKAPAGIEWPETVGINFEVSDQNLQELKPMINGLGLGLEFSQDPETGKRIITVYDLQTGAVIRQIPPKEVLAILRQIKQNKALGPGILLSRRL